MAMWISNCYDDDDLLQPGDRLTIQVHEGDDAPQPTGLYDAAGRPLVRHARRAPMGFDLTPRRPTGR